MQNICLFGCPGNPNTGTVAQPRVWVCPTICRMGKLFKKPEQLFFSFGHASGAQITHFTFKELFGMDLRTIVLFYLHDQTWLSGFICINPDISENASFFSKFWPSVCTEAVFLSCENVAFWRRSIKRINVKMLFSQCSVDCENVRIQKNDDACLVLSSIL